MIEPNAKEQSEFASATYWINRYGRGGNSGAGSYGRLAEYKAEIVNDLVDEYGITRVTEFGFGDGNQASLFQIPSYQGVDVVPQVVEAARQKFADRVDWCFKTMGEFEASPTSAEMCISLDVIYHLVEDQVFNSYMRRLTKSASKYVLIYASDRNKRIRQQHVRHRCYSDWMSAHAPEFQEKRVWEHPYPMTGDSNRKETSFAFFRLYERLGQAL